MPISKHGKHLAILGHRAAIQEIAEIQQRMAFREHLVEMHGPRTLPLRGFLRHVDPQHQVLAKAPENVKRERQADLERLETLYGLVMALEEMFRQYHEASDEKWGEGLRDLFTDRSASKIPS